MYPIVYFDKNFNKNWHKLKDQWTEFGMCDKNYGNLTNNWLESINQKLKNVIEKKILY